MYSLSLVCLSHIVQSGSEQHFPGSSCWPYSIHCRRRSLGLLRLRLRMLASGSIEVQSASVTGFGHIAPHRQKHDFNFGTVQLMCLIAIIYSHTCHCLCLLLSPPPHQILCMHSPIGLYSQSFLLDFLSKQGLAVACAGHKQQICFELGVLCSAWDRNSRSLSVITPLSVCLALSVVVVLLTGSCTGPALPLSFIPDPDQTHYSITWHFITLDTTLVVIFVTFLCLNLCALPLLSFNGFTMCLADRNLLCRLGCP